MKAIEISDEYLVRDSGTSDGSQDKYYKDGIWYKQDFYGGEGYCEYLCSNILKLSGIADDKYVSYREVTINGIKGCESDDFLTTKEEFITLYRLYANVKGNDISTIIQRMDYDDAIEYVISFVKEQTDLDIRRYLANTFAFDRMTRNTDRHMNNLGVIFNGDSFREAPIFDNGKSLLVGQTKEYENLPISVRLKKCYSKAFSPSYDLNYKYLKEYSDMKFEWEEIKRFLDDEPDSIHTNALRYLVSSYSKAEGDILPQS